MSETTWGEGPEGGLAPEAWSFLHSLPHDRFLWPYDIDGTIAHVEGLRACAVLEDEEAERLTTELRDMREHPELIDDADEDVHSAIERVLTERLGEVGAKVHAGRSRNDQVATATRLWARDAVSAAREAVVRLIEALADRADEHHGTLCPGYTHLQRAQPVTVGHWLCAHGFAFVRDVERLDAAYRSADVSPLGAGALATSTLEIDPSVAAEELGFTHVFGNSMDAVSDRDFLCDAAYACSMAMTHLSRLAEEIVLWSSAEYAFVELPGAYATGSSMMPQKRNPDVAELARGQAGRTIGALTGLVVTLKGLPLAYDRDLQADKEHLRGVFETTGAAFRATAGLVRGLTFDVDRLAEAASDDRLLATDLAEALVGRGIPFRRAHELVREVIAEAGEGPLLEGLHGVPEAAQALEDFDRGFLDPVTAARRRVGRGGPSEGSVRAQIEKLRSEVGRGDPGDH